MLLRDVIKSFEYRLKEVKEELAPLESGVCRCGVRASDDEDWRDVTEERIDRLRHEIIETQTIISRLKAHLRKD